MNEGRSEKLLETLISDYENNMRLALHYQQEAYFDLSAILDRLSEGYSFTTNAIMDAYAKSDTHSEDAQGEEYQPFE